MTLTCDLRVRGVMKDLKSYEVMDGVLGVTGHDGWSLGDITDITEAVLGSQGTSWRDSWGSQRNV